MCNDRICDKGYSYNVDGICEKGYVHNVGGICDKVYMCNDGIYDKGYSYNVDGICEKGYVHNVGRICDKEHVDMLTESGKSKNSFCVLKLTRVILSKSKYEYRRSFEL
jgi:hypothetical protein